MLRLADVGLLQIRDQLKFCRQKIRYPSQGAAEASMQALIKMRDASDRGWPFERPQMLFNDLISFFMWRNDMARRRTPEVVIIPNTSLNTRFILFWTDHKDSLKYSVSDIVAWKIYYGNGYSSRDSVQAISADGEVQFRDDYQVDCLECCADGKISYHFGSYVASTFEEAAKFAENDARERMRVREMMLHAGLAFRASPRPGSAATN
jgi:hypothetical protein